MSKSQVVAIKCPNLDDILMSHQTGFWATNQNVMTRIMDLHTNREDPSMKTLFLWSMPGRFVTLFCSLFAMIANIAQQALLRSFRASSFRFRCQDGFLGQGDWQVGQGPRVSYLVHKSLTQTDAAKLHDDLVDVQQAGPL